MNDEQQLPIPSLEEMIIFYKNERHKITKPGLSGVVFDQWLFKRYGISQWLNKNDASTLALNAQLLFPSCKNPVHVAGEFTAKMMYLWKEAEAVFNNKSASSINVLPYSQGVEFKNYLNAPMNMVE